MCNDSVLAFLSIALVAVVIYAGLVSYRTFGPEFAMFYVLKHDMGLPQLIDGYATLDRPWYRPTSFDLPYWLARQFLDWHNTPGWKTLELITAILAALLVYSWAKQVAGHAAASPRASVRASDTAVGLVAATYFLASPILFEAVYSVTSFEFIHLVLVIGTILLWHNKQPVFSLLCYCASLTAKETAIITPVYLTVTVAIESCRNKALPSRRTIFWLIAFGTVIAIYWFGHLHRIPQEAHAVGSDYRTGANFDAIKENLLKFPLWLSRIFGVAHDHTLQAREYDTPLNNMFGLACAIVTIVGVVLAIRRRPSASYAVLSMVAFMLIYLAIPIYSGGFLGHALLPLIGFSALFGLGVAELARTRVLIVSMACVIALTAIGTKNAWRHMRYGESQDIYRMNYNILNNPPVAFSRLHTGVPLVFIENRVDLGEWRYGAYGNLTRYAYLNPDIREKVVPPMSRTTPAQCTEFLQDQNAVYLTYDDQMRWSDSTAAFRQFCASRSVVH